ncbi:MAG TPA: hypothetical protein VD993_02040 [Chitinophagaceae bacterium]|nr:hypothetical protein [Chitinophagaceae bacterium]
MATVVFITAMLLTCLWPAAHGQGNNKLKDSTYNRILPSADKKKVLATSDFLDAAISSFNSLNSLIKKETYHTKITSFNNPTSSDIGFNLENEIQVALKPLLEKAKNTNTSKFSEIVSGLVAAQSDPKISLISAAPIFASVISLVSNLTLSERRITKKDLDSFIINVSKYFVQYEKLHQANTLFDENIDQLNSKLKDLQFDMREYMLDMLYIIYDDTPRSGFRNLNTEEMFLKYLDKGKLDQTFLSQSKGVQGGIRKDFKYPSDGIKAAKDIAYTLQKLFNEYEKIYTDNYMQIRSILLDTKTLGANVNEEQIDRSLNDLERLYNESKNSDVLCLRLNTLFERLKRLTATEQPETQK